VVGPTRLELLQPGFNSVALAGGRLAPRGRGARGKAAATPLRTDREARGSVAGGVYPRSSALQRGSGPPPPVEGARRGFSLSPPTRRVKLPGQRGPPVLHSAEAPTPLL
jgi:hypothetical protein